MERIELANLVRSAVDGKQTVDSIVEILLHELGRGGRTFIVDENIYDLADELTILNYTAYPVMKGTSDTGIKRELRSRVLITMNGQDFCDPKDMDKYHYGLIWITSNPDIKIVAKRVEVAIVTHNFKHNLIQVVKV